MKVAIVGRNAYDSLEGNVEETLNHMGHEARIFDVYELFPPLLSGRYKRWIYQLFQVNYGFATRCWVSVARRVLWFDPDLVVVTYRDVVPEAIACLKAHPKNFPVVHLNPDAITNLGRQYILTSPYDAYFTKEPFLADLMRNKFGLNAFYLPESFSPRVHRKPDRPKWECEEESDVDLVVIASLNPYRVRFLEELLVRLPESIKVAIYGKPVRFPWVKTKLWKYHRGGEIYGHEKSAAFYGARIALNTMHPSEFLGVNCRVFEALGSGAFLLSENRDVLRDVAEPNKEAVAFDSVEEAVRKVMHYLKRPEERFAIAEAGYRRAMRDHTYERRIECILSTLQGGVSLEMQEPCASYPHSFCVCYGG